MRIITMAFILLLAAGAVAEAKSPASVVLVATSSSRFEVIYTASENATVKITVTDEDGNRLTSRIVRNARNFRMPISFKELVPGKYHLALDNGSEVIRKELHIMRSRPIYSHVMKLDENRYLVSISNVASSRAIKISVYDGLTNLIQSIDEVVDGEKAVIVNTQRVKGTPGIEVSDPSEQSTVISN